MVCGLVCVETVFNPEKNSLRSDTFSGLKTVSAQPERTPEEFTINGPVALAAGLAE